MVADVSFIANRSAVFFSHPKSWCFPPIKNLSLPTHRSVSNREKREAMCSVVSVGAEIMHSEKSLNKGLMLELYEVL